MNVKNLILILILVCIKQSISQTLCFNPKESYPEDINPSSLCYEDFNKDGNIDLAIANTGGTISILLGNSLGSFGTAVNYSVDYLPRSICSADFNGDGNPDVATNNTGPGTVSVLWGDGAGDFTVTSAISTGIYNNSSRIAAADFNKDGNDDLVITSGYNFVLIALSDGMGNFNTPVQVTVNNNTHAVITADLNGDTFSDLAVTTYNSNYKISILLGNGIGGFGVATNFGVSDSPQSITSNDFNGDGNPDLATANMLNNSTGSLSILLGDGLGGFSTATDFGVGTATVPKSICSADFDKDGKIDLATATISNNNTPNLTLLLGNGFGSFGTAINFAVDSFPNSIVTADFDKDGKMDLALSTTKSNIDTGKVSILLNCSITGINKLVTNNKEIIIYPNPSHGIFTINLNEIKEIGKVEIYNMYGEKKYSTSTYQFQKQQEINFTKEQKGIYFVKVYIGTEIYTEKIVVQ